ncbi:melanocyte-stimulating hormone receptor-like [Oculina patagonica]
MSNFTADRNCPSELNQTSTGTWLTGTIAFLSAVNIFLSITAALGNALILVALHKESSLHPPTKLLFRCLAITDLCVGLISQPLHVSSIIFTKLHVVKLANYASTYILCGVSLLTSTAISVDRLLALLLGLRYRHVVTIRRVRTTIIGFWTIVASFGWTPFIALPKLPLTVFFVIVTFSLLTTILCYTKIYLTLRQHQAQLQDHFHLRQQNEGRIPLNIARYKKTVSSIAWVQLALVVCYAPCGTYTVLKVHEIMPSSKATDVVLTIIYLNSSLNPILYCWKIRDVRQAVKDTIRQFWCLLS